MNKLTPTYTVGHFTSTDHGFRQLPALFSSRWLDSIFDVADPSRIIEDQSSSYPYNISTYKNVDRDSFTTGDVTAYKIEVALAGVGRQNINVDVKDNLLTIITSKEDTEPADNVSYIKRGISRKKSTLSYRLDLNQLDVKNITSTYVDGLLTVNIPTVKKEVHKIDIKVNVD